MSTGLDGIVRLQEWELSVLAQDAPLTDVNAATVAEADDHCRVDIRFGRVPADPTHTNTSLNEGGADENGGDEDRVEALVAPEAVADPDDATVYTVGGADRPHRLRGGHSQGARRHRRPATRRSGLGDGTSTSGEPMPSGSSTFFRGGWPGRRQCLSRESTRTLTTKGLSRPCSSRSTSRSPLWRKIHSRRG